MRAEKRDFNDPAQSGRVYRCSRTAEHFLVVGPMLGCCRPDDGGAFQRFTSKKKKKKRPRLDFWPRRSVSG